VRPSTKAALAVVAVIVLVGGALATVYLLTRPAPRDEGIPTLEYYVTDLAGALSEDDAYYIGELCYEVDQNSSCEMAVLVVNSTGQYDIDYYAVRAFEYNGIGKSGKDNGVLIVVATDDQAWRVEVGYGLEGILIDHRVAELARTYLVPNMTAGSYGDGLFELTYALGDVLVNEYDGDRSGSPAYPIDGVPITWEGYLIIAVVVVVLSVVTRGRVLWPILWIIGALSGGRGRFGGGRSGGGGASGGR
jgi:uncharacterized protein